MSHEPQWWVAAIGDTLIWARLTVTEAGVAEVFDSDGRTLRYDGETGARMAQFGLDPKHYEWYRDFRRYGTVPHAGFGLGFERLVVYVCGLANIRDAHPYPRAAGLAEF